jgi:hypothetical protein
MVSNFPGSITIYGHGLMQAMVEDYKKSGVHEWLAEQEAKELGAGLNRKQRRALCKCR